MISWSSIMLGISIICGIAVLPMLIKYLQGGRRAYTFLQQVCIIIFSICSILIPLSPYSTTDLYEDFKKLNQQGFHVTINNILWVLAMGFVQEFFYHYYHYLSLAQSLDIYGMICNSFCYKSYNEPKFVAKVIFAGLVVSLIFSLDDAIQIISLAVMGKFGSTTYGRIRNGAFVLSLVKICVLKLTYGIGTYMIAKSDKDKLDESSNMIRNVDRKSAYKMLYYFTRIPFFINLALLGRDIPKLLSIGLAYHEEFSFWTGELYIATSLTISLCSFSYLLGYSFLIQELRNILFCHNAMVCCGKEAGE